MKQITLVGLWSVKGGVGKSTLAVHGAWALARAGAHVLVLDVDLTGSSLADGIELCAPRLPMSEAGLLDLCSDDQPGFVDRSETLRLRDRRQKRDVQQHLAVHLPYLNDAMLHEVAGRGECRLDHMAWTWPAAAASEPVAGSLLFLPSSPQRKDMAIAANWAKQEDDRTWSNRLESLLDLAAHQVPELTHLVLDLPPGPLGLSSGVIDMLVRISGKTAQLPAADGAQVQWSSIPVLVTTPDRNDLFIATEYYLHHRPRMPSLQLLVNKASPGLAEERHALRERFGSIVQTSGVEHSPAIGLDDRGLGRTFRGEPRFPARSVAATMVRVFGGAAWAS